jgi:hypothetical protein
MTVRDSDNRVSTTSGFWKSTSMDSAKSALKYDDNQLPNSFLAFIQLH